MLNKDRSINEYITGETNLPVCKDLSEENREEEFLAAVCVSTADNGDEDDNEDGNDDDNNDGNDNDGDNDDVMEIEEEESMPKINTY